MDINIAIKYMQSGMMQYQIRVGRRWLYSAASWKKKGRRRGSKKKKKRRGTPPMACRHAKV
jgi:hypothetical protein